MEDDMKEQPGATSDFARGVDITAAHGAFDWKAAATAGVKFGYVTHTGGAAQPTAALDANWRAMKDVGILRGACHYLRPLKDPEGQARHFGELLRAIGGSELPPAVRVKTVPTQTGLNEWDVLRPDKRVELLLRWLKILEETSERKCVLSTNAAFVRRYLSGATEVAEYDLWIAEYRPDGQPATPGPWDRWTFWRYSETGKFPGLTGTVCLNYFNGTRGELDRYASGAGGSQGNAGEPGSQTDTGAQPVSQTGVEGATLEPEPPVDEGPVAGAEAAEPARGRSRRPAKREDA